MLIDINDETHLLSVMCDCTEVEGGLAPSGPLSGTGYFLSLKLHSDDWSQYDAVYAGLEPSAGTGLVRIDQDPDKQITMKLTVEDHVCNQKFVIVSYGGNTSVRKEYDLSPIAGL